MAEPTKGPWTVQAETHVMAGDRLVAGCGGYWCNDGGEHRAENAANARLIAKARHLPELIEALENVLELFERSDENSMARFERVAALYYGETGRLAPGKDVPMASADRTTIEKRHELYDNWMQNRVDQAAAALALVQETE